MLYREIIVVCSVFQTKHINTLSGQNVKLLNVKLAVRIMDRVPPNGSQFQCVIPQHDSTESLKSMELSHS